MPQCFAPNFLVELNIDYTGIWQDYRCLRLKGIDKEDFSKLVHRLDRGEKVKGCMKKPLPASVRRTGAPFQYSP